MGGMLAVATTFNIGGRATAASPITLKLATADTKNDTSYAIAQRFGEEIAKRTNGKYKLHVYVGGELGSTRNLASSLQTGILDTAILTAGYLESFVPSVQVIDLPFVFKDEATAEKLLDGEVGKKLFSDMKTKGIIGLAWGWYGWRQMEIKGKAVSKPDDLKGMKVRIQPGPVFAAMFKELGAIPIVLDGSEVYLALSQGTVSAIDFPLPTAVTFKAYEVTKYLALTRHVYNAGALMVSKLRWGQMTDEDRQAFQAAANDVLPVWRQSIAQASDKALDFCKQHGMTVTDTDFQAFREKMTPVYKQFRPQYPELFDMIANP